VNALAFKELKLVLAIANREREREQGRSMSLFKTLTALIIAIVLVGMSPVWTHAAEATKKLAADRIMTPTKIKPLDINSGSVDQLKTLPGIDGVYAQKIVESRPYQKRDELLSRKIIPEATYKKIKDRIITLPGS
jgi:DNA uptake protein ComE-like DNA-binding protein